MRRFLLLASLIVSAFTLKAQQPAYKITLQVKHNRDSVIYLANYFGDKTYLKDTAWFDMKKGVAVFDGNTPLPNGIYIFAARGLKLFELVISKEQVFTIETDTTYEPGEMKVKGSEENKLFLDYLVWVNKKGMEADELRKKTKKEGITEPEIADLRAKMKDIDNQVADYKKNFANAHPGMFLSDVFNLMRDPEIPEMPMVTRADTIARYNYYKAHYFDLFNWKEDGILRTPVFHSKLHNYLENMTSNVPDSIIREADMIVAKANAGNKEVFKYCVQYITNTYENPKYMGQDAVFVHMAKTYYCTGQAFWVDEELKKKICDRAIQLEPLTIGHKAPNLVLLDSANKPHSMYNTKARYTILYFWDPECGHCQQTTPVVLDVYKKYKPKGLEVYAIYTEKNMSEWKKAIREKKLGWINVADPDQYSNYKHTYDIFAKPVIYVLDENKKIVAKRIDAKQLEDLLNHLYNEKEKEQINKEMDKIEKGKHN